MLKKSALAVVATLLIGSASNASAEAGTNDANTGLWMMYHYDTLANLQKQGLPLSPAAQKYLKEHPAPVQARPAKRGNNVYLLEDTQGILAPRNLQPEHNTNNFQNSFTSW